MTKVVMIKTQNCIACKRMGKVLDDAGIQIEQLDAYQHPKLALDNDIQMVPAFLKFDGDVVIDKHVGPMTVDEYHEFAA